MKENGPPPIIVRRVKRTRGGRHGGAWKVAYADFVTAMMAFFLVMWLLGMGTNKQRGAISKYFNDPSMTQGVSAVPPSGAMGPGGASDSMIKLGGAMDLPKPPIHGSSHDHAKPSPLNAEEAARRLEHKRLEALQEKLHAAIERSQALKPFKDQLFLDITPAGLRIQIVDKKNRPMFDTGSATLKPYTAKILHELAGFINQVPNLISISGHTDDASYANERHFSNWELSADRANAARRALVAGGMRVNKVSRVVGLADSVPFDKAHPGAAINRRIAIVVMTKAAAEAAMSPQMASSSDRREAGLPLPAKLQSATVQIPAVTISPVAANAAVKADGAMKKP